MAISDPTTYLLLLITLGVVHLLNLGTNLVIIMLALKGVDPAQRPDLLRTLPGVIKACRHDWGAIIRALPPRQAKAPAIHGHRLRPARTRARPNTTSAGVDTTQPM